MKAILKSFTDGLITAITFFPSFNTGRYMKTIDPKVKDMFLSIGFNNGVFFFQAIPDKDDIYIYEMGLRTGGGMTYKITEATSGNNDLEMLIHYAITGEMCEEEDIKTIDRAVLFRNSCVTLRREKGCAGFLV